MSDMIERVARAMHEELAGGDPDELIHHPAQNSWEQPTRKRWEQWEDAARAAIEAMREPTEAMKLAGCKHDDPLGELVDWRGADTTTREAVGGVFTAMIDAALEECQP